MSDTYRLEQSPRYAFTSSAPLRSKLEFPPAHEDDLI